VDNNTFFPEGMVPMGIKKALIIGIVLTALATLLDFLQWGWIRYIIIFCVTVLIVSTPYFKKKH
jgi:hypothetical protein